MQKIIGAKKYGDNSLNFFVCPIDVKVGDNVVVSVDEFQTIVKVLTIDEKFSRDTSDFGKVLRLATDADNQKFDSLAKKAKSELPIFKKKSLELGLMMKFVGAEYSLDGSKVLIIFSSEERVDFRQFLKELASMLKTRIELRQIGQRDEVKIMGDEKVSSLIGFRGEGLNAYQFLINNFRALRNKSKRILIDVENYRNRREESLRSLANRIAKKVVKTKKRYKFEPMSAFERHIIHEELASFEGITTHSEGVEPRRCLIVDIRKPSCHL